MPNLDTNIPSDIYYGFILSEILSSTRVTYYSKTFKKPFLKTLY